MSRSSAHSRRRGAFTLPELLLAVTLSGILFTAILSAYLFLGRSLTRLVNLQQQDVQSRRALRQFTDDASAAISLATATATEVSLIKRQSSGTATVTYTYSTSGGTLTRTDASGARTLVSGVTQFALTYYNEGGTAVTASPQSVKSMELSFSTTVGSAANGTRARYTTVSPRVVLRNKPALQ